MIPLKTRQDTSLLPFITQNLLINIPCHTLHFTLEFGGDLPFLLEWNGMVLQEAQMGPQGGSDGAC